MIAVLAAAGFALAAAAEPPRVNAWTQPRVLRYAIADNPKNLSAMQAVTAAELSLERLLFDVLVSYDQKLGRRVPQLATRIPTLENGDITPDGKRITYHLRHGVRWHDGAPFTSDDVRFTFDAIMSPHNIVMWRTGFDKVTRLETPDPYTVVFHFARPYPPAIDELFADGPWPYGILPAHILRKEASLDRSSFFTDRPIGTGPFKFQRWVHGERIELVANPDYFLGKPKLERIIVRLVPDPQTRALLATTHEIDWYAEVPPSLIGQLARIDGFERVDVPQNRFTSIAFNMKHPPLDDRDVRLALSMAIDRARLVRNVTFGSAAVARADLPPIVWTAPPGFPDIANDPKAATTLLDRAGWKVGAGGIRERDGKPLHLSFAIFGGSPEASGLSLLVQSQLAAIGIATDIRSVPRLIYYAPASDGGIMFRGDFDLAISTWASGYDPDNSAVYGCAYVPPNGYNWARYCSAEMEAAQNTALSTFDERRRKAAYDTVERLAIRDLPHFVLWWPVNVQFVNRDFRGFNPNIVNETFGAQLWDI